MDVDQQQNKASFITLTNLNKIDESKSEVFQDDNKSQNSNNASEDSSDDEEVMIKQESNYEGQGDLDAIEEENKDQILNDDQDFSIIQKYPQVLRERHCYLKKILQRLLREIINLEFQKSNYFQKD